MFDKIGNFFSWCGSFIGNCMEFVMEKIVLPLLIGILVFMTVFFILFLGFTAYEEIRFFNGTIVYDSSYTERIYSYERGNEISGIFFLGIGSVENTQYYYIYRYNSSFKSYYLSKFEVNNTLINFTSENPYIQKHKFLYKQNKNGKHSLILPGNDKYILYLPKDYRKVILNLED